MAKVIFRNVHQVGLSITLSSLTDGTEGNGMIIQFLVAEAGLVVPRSTNFFKISLIKV